MRKEAQNPKYQVDSFFISEFKKIPGDLGYDDLFPEQKTFLMYLTALAPTKDTIRSHVYFETKKEEIEITDYIQTSLPILKMQAKQAKLSLEDFREFENNKIRNQKISELEEHMGYKTKSENKAEAMYKKYEDVMNKMKTDNLKPQMDILNILNNPLKTIKKD